MTSGGEVSGGVAVAWSGDERAKKAVAAVAAVAARNVVLRSREPVKPEASPPPLPALPPAPPPKECDQSCGMGSCLETSAFFNCQELMVLGCDCGGCCMDRLED